MARAKMEEEASLYKYRATTHEIELTNEGEVDSEVVRQTFPMYDTEFEELGGEGEGKSEEREELGGVGDKQEPLCQFTCSEMREVSELHQKLFGAQQPSNSSQSSEVFSSRYSFAASLAQLLDHIPGTITFITFNISVYPLRLCLQDYPQTTLCLVLMPECAVILWESSLREHLGN